MNRPLPRTRLPALLALIVCAALLGACSLLPLSDERDAISGASANESAPPNTARQATPSLAVIPVKGGAPAEVAQAFVTAYAAFDKTAVASYSCAPRQPQILATLQAFKESGGDVKIDVSQLKYTQHSAYDRTAQVDVDGEVTISGDQQRQGSVGVLLDEEDNDALYLVMELTGWKVCPTR